MLLCRSSKMLIAVDERWQQQTCVAEQYRSQAPGVKIEKKEPANLRLRLKSASRNLVPLRILQEANGFEYFRIWFCNSRYLSKTDPGYESIRPQDQLSYSVNS